MRAAVHLKGILQQSKPQRKHTNHNCLFVLARGVLALEGARGKAYSLAELRDIFRQWYASALPYVRENLTSDDYFMEFCELHDYADTPLGGGIVEKAWLLAQSEPPPLEAKQFDSPDLQLLTALCWQLQRIVGDDPFYISCRTVQRLFGLETHAQAARRLRGLVRVGVLEEEAKGGPLTQRASRYFFTGASAKGAPNNR